MFVFFPFSFNVWWYFSGFFSFSFAVHVFCWVTILLYGNVLHNSNFQLTNLCSYIYNAFFYFPSFLFPFFLSFFFLIQIFSFLFLTDRCSVFVYTTLKKTSVHIRAFVRTYIRTNVSVIRMKTFVPTYPRIMKTFISTNSIGAMLGDSRSNARCWYMIIL